MFESFKRVILEVTFFNGLWNLTIFFVPLNSLETTLALTYQQKCVHENPNKSEYTLE